MLFPLLQLGISIALILLLALTAWKLRLGTDVRIRDADHARDLARDTLDGFDPVELALDRAGIGALLRDDQGRVMLLRRHGAQFVGRILDTHAFARLDCNFLTIGTGEASFGNVTLELGQQAQIWASSLRRLKG